MGNDAALEQASVTGQQNPALATGDIGQFCVGVVIAIQGVKPEHPQIRGQTAQMHVEHKTGFAQGLGSEPNQRGNIKRLKDMRNPPTGRWLK